MNFSIAHILLLSTQIKNIMKIEILNNQKIRCYDNQGKTIDRYTVIYLDQPERHYLGKIYNGRGMSIDPFHGVGQMVSAAVGSHLGKRIAFKDLPKDCQKVVNDDLTIIENI